VIKEANHAISAINYQLRRTNFAGKEKDIEKILSKILDEISMANQVYQIPKVKLSIHECVRNSLLQKISDGFIEGI